MESLAVKYRPKKFEEVTEQNVIKSILLNQIKSGDIKNSYLFCGPSGCGKSIPLTSDILTINGYKKMKDIQVGDLLFTHNGNVAPVFGVYPQGIQRTYRIILSDDTSIDVSEDHLNVVYELNEDSENNVGKEYVVETKDLIAKFNSYADSNKRIYISPVGIDDGFIFEEPYIDAEIMGMISGCGFCDNGQFHIVCPEEVVDNINYELKDFGLYFESVNKDDDEYRLFMEKDFDRKAWDIICGMCGYGLTLRVPKEYYITSHENRMRFINGVMNVCGIRDTDDAMELYLFSKVISDRLAFCFRTLGFVDKVEVVKDVNKSGRSIYIHYLLHENGNISRYIKSIEYVGEVECQCIKVDHEDATYIVGNGLIPTHNTTNARIFANDINENNGSIIELDAASHNTVDDVAKIIDESKFKPLSSKYKIIIVDECHSITTQGWQKFLKTIEEPTPTSIFIFCTTDPQKIPPTILSRVQRYNFQKISYNGIIDRLQFILDSENAEGHNYTYEHDALAYLAKLSEGGMRSAITLMEKVLGYTNDITMKSITDALGTVDYNVMFDLTKALSNRDKKDVISIIEEVHRSGADLKQFVKNYSSFILDLCTYKICGSFEYLQMPNIYQDEVNKFRNSDFYFFMNMLTMVVELNSEIKWESQPKPVIVSKLLLICLDDGLYEQ